MPYGYSSIALLVAVVGIVSALPLLHLDLGYNHGDYYLMRLQECNNTLTIHGLWAQWADDCSGPSFNVTELDPILNQMNTDWPSCVGHSTNADFWAHEWSKHGTCSNLEQLKYFQTVLRLYGQYKYLQQTDICFDKQFNHMDCPSNSTATYYDK
eukprot:m.355537 g.355537  ORF g.355537 m.355537 type:complete len:154 (+) comp17273_c0_seq1:176-637(+)